MSGEGIFPFDPERIAALGRLAASINGTQAAACFLTQHGLRALIADLQAIDAQLRVIS